ncbi:hypothetical protein CMI48_02895 [Candidatus Pacearchaeota archaeon]|nr:hypothetical protein [Candidatus Pacearchaeota archaeon]
MEQEKLLRELENGFAAEKERLGFSVTLDELDEMFFVRDSVLDAGFVSKNLSRQLARRVVETYMSWNEYLNGLMMPNPHHLLQATEHKLVDDETKKDAMKLMSKAMVLVSRNTNVGLTKDEKEEGKWFDEVVPFWKETYLPVLENVMGQVVEGWKEQAGK